MFKTKILIIGPSEVSFSRANVGQKFLICLLLRSLSVMFTLC